MADRSMTKELAPHERIILAYDRTTLNRGDQKTLLSLSGKYGWLKFGYETLFRRTAQGSVAHGLRDLRIKNQDMCKGFMADFKFRGTADTLGPAAETLLSQLSPYFFTIDATMPYRNIHACCHAVRDHKAIVIGVGAPSDHTEEDVQDIFNKSVGALAAECVDKLSEAMHETLVATAFLAPPPDLVALREEVTKYNVDYDHIPRIAVAVRSHKSPRDNHSRWGTPTEAIEAGADYLVIGRPIMGADEPTKAADQIADVIRAAL